MPGIAAAVDSGDVDLDDYDLSDESRDGIEGLLDRVRDAMGDSLGDLVDRVYDAMGDSMPTILPILP